MPIYQVIWEYTADVATPLEAAQAARCCQRAQLANGEQEGVFDVRLEGMSATEPITIDLSEQEEKL